MAAMDFRLSRDDRGPSVVWHILGTGAGTFALLALVLILADAGGEELGYDDGGEPEILVQSGEETVVGRANTEAGTPENDPTYTGDTVTVSGPTGEGDLSVSDVEADVSPGEPVDGALVESQDEEVLGADGIPETAGTAAESDEGIEGTGGGVETDQEELVIDPDGTTAPVVPTPSGPAGDDDNELTQD